jgi:ATP synthase subunit 6
MSLLSVLFAPLVALVLQHAPAAPANPPQAEPAEAGQQAEGAAGAAHESPGDEHVSGEHAADEHASGEHGKMSPGDIFLGLFKHLEPHAVGAVWFGGSKGFGFVPPYDADAAGQPRHLDEHGNPATFHDRAELNEHYAAAFGGGQGILIYNINTAQWLAAITLVVVVILAARSARRQSGQAPRGTPYHLIESVVLYVRDDMVYPVMGKEVGERFVPLFLTQFFFILFMNLFGLLPFGLFGLGHFGATATANLAVTGGMALTTLLFIHFSGMREHGFVHHWKNFVPHGLPWFVLPIIIPVEIIGMLVKPAALTIRLFANMTAGHLVVLSFFGLIYLFGSYLIGAPVLGMSIAIYSLELFVCFVQAYIFTYLSIIFVGASVHPEH